MSETTRNDSVGHEDYWNNRLKAEELSFSVYAAHENFLEEMAERHMQILAPYKALRVLDAGCGYGRMSKYFSNYTGVDFATGFIEKAKELYPNKTFIKANLKSLPFRDKEFDLAFCVMVEGNVTNNLGKDEWLLMEKELNRVAKKLITLEP